MIVYSGHPRGSIPARLPLIGAASLDSHAKIPIHFHSCIDFRVSVWHQVTSVSVCVSTFSIFMLQLSKNKTQIKTGPCKRYVAAIGKRPPFRILSRYDHNDVSHRWYKWFTTARLMYHMRGSDGVRSMMEREWGHRWLLQAWDNLSVNFWPELNTNAQTQHATAAGGRTNTQHSPSLMQLLKTKQKNNNSCTSLFDLVDGGKRKKTMSKIIQQQCCAVASVWRQMWAWRYYLWRDWTRCVYFPLVWSRNGYDHMYEGVKGRLCVWKHIDCLSVCLTLAQQWQTCPPRHCCNHLFNIHQMLLTSRCPAHQILLHT